MFVFEKKTQMNKVSKFITRMLSYDFIFIVCESFVLVLFEVYGSGFCGPRLDLWIEVDISLRSRVRVFIDLNFR